MIDFDPFLPLDEAATLPARYYVEDSLYRRELHSIFHRHWVPVARMDQLSGPGKYVASEIGEAPVVVICGKDGELRAFHNVCRHHATALVSGAGELKDSFVCPYHAWAYDFEGSLLRTPHCGALKNFCREEFGLVPVALEVWGPWVWVNLDENAKPFAKKDSELDWRLEGTRWRSLLFVKRFEYEIDCNWKVFVDNYLDGGYHVGSVHPGLAGQLNLQSYRTEFFDEYSIQSCGSNDEDLSRGKDFGGRLGDKVVYAHLYPNFMINRYGPILDSNLVLPLGVNKTQVVFEYFFDREALNRGDFVDQSIAASHQVQLEDMDVCTSVQRGLRSPAYNVGRYAPAQEGAMYHFHRQVWNQLNESSKS